MNAVAGQVRRTVESIRDRILKDILKQQKPELDKKIDEMLKPPKVNRIMLRYLGAGKSLGRKMGGAVRRGLSLLRKII